MLVVTVFLIIEQEMKQLLIFVAQLIVFINALMHYISEKYSLNDVVSFKRTHEDYVVLSNMCAGFPIMVNGQHFLTSEALYQAGRFPHLPEVLTLLLESPMYIQINA